MILVLEGKKKKERKKKQRLHSRQFLASCRTNVDFKSIVALTSTLMSVRTNVHFNVGRKNVAVALMSAAQTSMRTNVDYHLCRCSLLSVAQNSRHR